MRWTIARNFRGKSERRILDDMVFERFEVDHHFAGEWLRTPPPTQGFLEGGEATFGNRYDTVRLLNRAGFTQKDARKA